MKLLTCTWRLLVLAAQVTDLSNPVLSVLLETKTLKGVGVCGRVYVCVCSMADYSGLYIYSEGAEAANPACNRISGQL